ncbi:MAG: Holliday junction resolvase RuvX [Alphaproteobacteria bacterium]|nr:Holliday junction resolvase RuvX [Alphaproteobacteria bacterium]
MYTDDISVFIEAIDAQRRSRHSRLLGIDPGNTSIGVAMSEPLFKLATPFGTFRSRKLTPKARYLTDLIGEWKVCGMVVGDPKNQHGGITRQGQSVRTMLHNLQRLHDVDVPILLWDERFSSQTGLLLDARSVRTALRPRSRQPGAFSDDAKSHAIAALTILQSALDAIHMHYATKEAWTFSTKEAGDTASE